MGTEVGAIGSVVSPDTKWELRKGPLDRSVVSPDTKWVLRKGPLGIFGLGAACDAEL